MQSEIINRDKAIEPKEVILILDGEEDKLRQMYEILTEVDYDVLLARTMVEALESLRLLTVSLIIICGDIYDADSQNIYDLLSDTIRAKGVQSLVMKEALFTEELINKVKTVLD